MWTSHGIRYTHEHFHFLAGHHTDDRSPISLCLENVRSVEIDCLFDPRDFICLFSIGKCTERAMPNENKACQGRESPKGLQMNWHSDLQCRFCWMFGFGVNTSLCLSLSCFLLVEVRWMILAASGSERRRRRRSRRRKKVKENDMKEAKNRGEGKARFFIYSNNWWRTHTPSILLVG